MQTAKYVYWREDDAWLGYLEEFPDDWTQGDSLDDLIEHLTDLFRDLMAALSAYREKRYSDFARLAGSHWARNVSGGPAAHAVAGDRSGVIRTGDSSALPPGKRLR